MDIAAERAECLFLLIIDALKPYFVQLLEKKYSFRLAQKAYYYAPKRAQRLELLKVLKQ